MVAPTPASLVLTGATCLQYSTPMLYIWRRGQEVLYVGKAAAGIVRPLRFKAMDPDDTLELLLRPYACTMGLLSEESRLIDRLKPVLNTKWPEPHHRSALKDHPDDCPLSGEHAQSEYAEALAAATQRVRASIAALLLDQAEVA